MVERLISRTFLGWPSGPSAQFPGPHFPAKIHRAPPHPGSPCLGREEGEHVVFKIDSVFSLVKFLTGV